jgi:hypothetical protein
MALIYVNYYKRHKQHKQQRYKTQHATVMWQQICKLVAEGIPVDLNMKALLSEAADTAHEGVKELEECMQEINNSSQN